jgi:hypothetical protein
MKVARVNSRRSPILSSPSGVGGGTALPALDDLTDVDTSGVADGDVLTFESGEWIALPGGGAATTMWAPVMTETTIEGCCELAVIPGSPPDSLYADGDWLYITDSTDAWFVVVTGDGDAVMTEIPL